MSKYVLVSDPTLSFEHSLLSYRLPSMPGNYIPLPVYRLLAAPPVPHDDGRARFAPYGLRKIEAALLDRWSQVEVVVAHPDYVHLFIGPETEIIGVHTMDPIGLSAETMFFTNGRTVSSVQERTFSNFMSKLHSERLNRSSSAKIVVGGAGSWELQYAKELTKRLHIDHVVQGEVDDVAPDLLEQLARGEIDNRFVFGYQTFDERYRKIWDLDEDHVFVTRAMLTRQNPEVREIPEIRGASARGLVEVMRGCGIGCDFCEVTLRPLRYIDPEIVKREISINMQAGLRNAWIHSDEVFAYEHGRNFEPNEDALIGLFSAVMSMGVDHANPTHGRISIPAGYPELIVKLSRILRAGPRNWIAVQVGIETGSDELARKHMPAKTLPLRIGPDGTWAKIVTEGVRTLNRNYWRPAFTVQIGQSGETPEDNWDTVGLINDLSKADNEFTITPLVNVPLGLLKTAGSFHPIMDDLDEAQASVIYACFRHMQREVYKHTAISPLVPRHARMMAAHVLTSGFAGITYALERFFKRKGLKMSKAKTHSLQDKPTRRLLTPEMPAVV